MFNASRLAIARKRRQLTKKDLAEKADITALTLTRIENGETTEPEAETVAALARALAYPAEFFTLDDCEELETEAVSFRSLSSLTARQRDSALAAGSIAFLLDDWVNARFELPTPDLIDLRDEDPAAAAEALRAHWGLGSKPVATMVKLLEAKGVRVFALSEQHKNVDAYSCWKDDVPYIFLNTFKSAERSRFDAAHELGHLVLHIHGASGGRDVEREADQFASHFLIPRGDLLSNLSSAESLSALVAGKKRWGVSVAALARTAFDAGLITDWHYRELCKQMSFRGFRTEEPEPMVREQSVLWKKILEELWRDGITRENIAKDLKIPEEEIHSLMGDLVSQPNVVAEAGRRPVLRVI